MGEGIRYFQIGFKKCGTTSLACFFDRNGIRAVHFDWGQLGRRMERNRDAGVPLLTGYERYDAFTNMEYSAPDGWFDGFRCWPELMECYADSHFILNTRSLDNWLKSMLPRDPGKRSWRTKYFEARWGTSDPVELSEIWTREWEEHHSQVRAGIPSERLLVFDIERDPPERLCDFIGLPHSAARHWRVENPTMHRWGAWAAARIPVPVKRVVPVEVVLSAKRLLRRPR